LEFCLRALRARCGVPYARRDFGWKPGVLFGLQGKVPLPASRDGVQNLYCLFDGFEALLQGGQKEGEKMTDLGLVSLGATWVFDCAVLVPFCRYAGLNTVSCLKWGTVCIVGQLLMSAVG